MQNSRSYFAAIGFDFEEFGADTVLVRSAPTSIAIGDCRDVFTFLAGKLAEGNGVSERLASMAKETGLYASASAEPDDPDYSGGAEVFMIVKK